MFYFSRQHGFHNFFINRIIRHLKLSFQAERVRSGRASTIPCGPSRTSHGSRGERGVFLRAFTPCYVSAKLGQMRAFLKLQIMCNNLKRGEMHGNQERIQNLTIAFLLFTSLFKWQPWASLLHLPLFILWAPIIATVLTRIPKITVSNLIALILILAALPWLLSNDSRPILGKKNIFTVNRIDQYFNRRQELRESYIASADYLNSRKCKRIGLHMDWDDREYPFWVLLEKNEKCRIRIDHIDVRNRSSVKYKLSPFNEFRSCTVISIGNAPKKKLVTEDDVLKYGQWRE